MSYVMVDVEADGPIPGDYSMVSFGAIVVDGTLDKTFYGELRPVSDRLVPRRHRSYWGWNFARRMS